MGLPFNRIRKWQDYLGVPLSASVQWERCENLMNSVFIVYRVLLKLFSNAWLFYGDDTGNKVLSIQRQARLEGSKRKGVWTTGIVGQTKRGVINLFFTGMKHCGENVEDLLKERTDKSTAIYMSDSLSRNFKKGMNVFWANCNAHARRKFWDYRDDYPQMVKYVLCQFGKIYGNDKICKEKGYTDDERLQYHQKHSGRVMLKLRRWFLLKLYLKKIEPNEELGKSIKYFFTHYEKLTLYLRLPGAPLDNNASERLLKITDIEPEELLLL